jgi:hypothetical protein
MTPKAKEIYAEKIKEGLGLWWLRPQLINY